MEAPPLRVSWVIVFHFGVAVEAKGDRIRDVAAFRGVGPLDVIDFDLDAAESMADATPAVTFNQQSLGLGLVEFVARHQPRTYHKPQPRQGSLRHSVGLASGPGLILS